MRPRRGRAALLSGLLLLLAGCTPLYLPPVPESMPRIESRLTLRDARVEVDADGQVRAVWIPEGVDCAGWLDVQWFPPAGRAVASESVWLAPEHEGRRQALSLPDEVELRPGRWRAVLSFEGEVLRQLDWSWPSGESNEAPAP